MAVRIQNLPKRNFGQAQVAANCPSWWNPNEQQSSGSLSKNISSKAASSPQLYHEGKHLGFQLLDQDSYSTQSMSQSHNEVSLVGGTSSQDQCISSESGEDESCGKSAEERMKPVFLFSNREIIFNPTQADNNHLMAHAPFPFADHYAGSLFTPYGSQAMMGSQIVGLAGARVPLPLDLADDGPIYVNAKQYHGILRRRQSRAKQEAQNKLVKSRKPYLHESRHLHALNRVRGSGGRFLSKKEARQHDPTSTQGGSDSTHTEQKNGTSELENFHYMRAVNSGGSNCSTISMGEASFRARDQQFSGMSGGMQNSGRLMYGGT